MSFQNCAKLGQGDWAFVRLGRSVDGWEPPPLQRSMTLGEGFLLPRQSSRAGGWVRAAFQGLEGRRGALCSWRRIREVHHSAHHSQLVPVTWCNTVYAPSFWTLTNACEVGTVRVPILWTGKWGITTLKNLPLFTEQQNWHSHPV